MQELTDEELERLYRSGLSMRDIAEAHGIAVGTVYNRLRRAGVETRPRKTEQTREVLAALVAEGMSAADIARNRGVSGALILKMLKKYELRAADGRSLQPPRPRHDRRRVSGYWYVFRPDHPYADKRGMIAEHRVVVEAAIGRYLTRTEVVHHMNHQRDDNRLENLMLLPDSAAHGRVHHAKGKQFADGNAVRWKKS